MGVIKIKTLVELFDICQLENVIAGLKLKPERIIYIGAKGLMSKRKQKAIENFYKKKGVTSQIQFEPLEKYELDEAVKLINKILDNNEDCRFDLTGGDWLTNTALGLVSAVRPVKLFRFDVKKSRFVNVLNCGNSIQMKKSMVTIDEALELNCASRVKTTFDTRWDITEAFKRDIDRAWNAVCDNYEDWNGHTNALNFFLRRAEEIKPCHYQYLGDTADFKLNENIMKALEAYGLITDYEFTENKLSFKFKNCQVRELLNKAGNPLELVCYTLLRELKENFPDAYSDVAVGVNVDWDGEIHSEYDAIKDTRNEIDVMVMTGVKPVFISCKNCTVKKEALYELSTAAKHYGGKYASMVLVSTKAPENDKQYAYIKQRAKDMNITLLDNACDYTREGLKNELAKVTK